MKTSKRHVQKATLQRRSLSAAELSQVTGGWWQQVETSHSNKEAIDAYGLMMERSGDKYTELC